LRKQAFLNLAPQLKWAEGQRAAGLSTVPSVLLDEMQYNPFLRTNEKAIQEAVGTSDPVEVMRRLRALKDQFRA
jgi:hydroxyacylglutathione hydrolase